MDFGLYWGNLYMCRIPESVAILIEPAFMIIPEQEKLLSTDEFQYKIAEAVKNGLEDFFQKAAE
jgi:N-acetylmuramoyl-L-alanine amidase